MTSLNQISPEKLPNTSSLEYPAPWKKIHLGNGRVHVVSSNQRLVGYVFCQHTDDWNLLVEKLEKVNKTYVTP